MASCRTSSRLSKGTSSIDPDGSGGPVDIETGMGRIMLTHQRPDRGDRTCCGTRCWNRSEMARGPSISVACARGSVDAAAAAEVIAATRWDLCDAQVVRCNRQME